MATTLTKAKIAKEDIQSYDGVTSTFTRATSTGGTQTLHKVDYMGIDCVQAYGSGTTKTDATITSAVSTLGSTVVNLWLEPGTWTISNSVTIPANVTLQCPPGCKISIDSGKTLTVNGPIESGHYDIFDGSGTVVFGQGGVGELNPAWWGFATSASAAVNAAAFNACLLSAMTAGIDIYIAPGIYVCDPILYTKTGSGNKSGITIRGAKNNDEVADGKSYLNFSALSGSQIGIEFKDSGTSGQIVGMTFKDIALFGPSGATSTVGIHIHASVSTGNGIRQLNIKNVAVERFDTGIKIEGDGAGNGQDNWPLYMQSVQIKDFQSVGLFLGQGNTIGLHNIVYADSTVAGAVGIYIQGSGGCQTFNSPLLQNVDYGFVFDTLQADGVSAANIRGITINSPYMEGVKYGFNVGYKVDGATASGAGSAKSFVINGGQNEDPTAGGTFIRNSLGVAWFNNVLNAMEIDTTADISGNPAKTTLTSSRLAVGTAMFYDDAGVVTSPVQATGSANILRMSRLYIQDASSAEQIQPSLISTDNLNGDTIAAEDDLAKGSSTTSFSLSAGGDTLTIKGSAISGNPKGIHATVSSNASATAILVQSTVNSNNIVLAFTNATTGAAVDLGTLVDTGEVNVQLLVINDS